MDSDKYRKVAQLSLGVKVAITGCVCGSVASVRG